jgi:preprotein translocase subunit SecA
LRAYGQRDPLIEYKLEGQKMFDDLQHSIKGQVANLIFKVSFIQQPKQVQMEERRPDVAQGLKSNTQGQNRNQALDVKPSALSSPNIGRNDPCPCGSGKKYKKCHGA